MYLNDLYKDASEYSRIAQTKAIINNNNTIS